MGQHRARQAQVWAIRMAEELGSFIVRENIPLPYELKNYPVVVQGQAIRHCQEVNLAKKQLDALNKQMGRAVPAINWVLKYRLLDPARQPGDDPDYRPRAILYVDYARGRQVKTNMELETNVEQFILSLRNASAESTPIGAVLEPLEPFPGGAGTSPQQDAMEDLLKKTYGM